MPGRYDVINRIFTLGQDEPWRKRAARMLLEPGPERVLDICCGTADLAIRLARMATPGTQVFGLDYSRTMLEVARQKAARRGLADKITFVHGDVSDMPFPDGHFDVIGIAFAFRNLTYKNPKTQRYLAEIVRILKPGGQFVIVESSQPTNRVIRALAHSYERWLVYGIGVLISGNKPAYKYLSESSQRFYTAEELGDLLAAAGFSRVHVKRLMFGATAIHVAIR